jgi:hypothetical protein
VQESYPESELGRACKGHQGQVQHLFLRRPQNQHGSGFIMGRMTTHLVVTGPRGEDDQKPSSPPFARSRKYHRSSYDGWASESQDLSRARILTSELIVAFHAQVCLDEDMAAVVVAKTVEVGGGAFGVRSTGALCPSPQPPPDRSAPGCLIRRVRPTRSVGGESPVRGLSQPRAST